MFCRACGAPLPDQALVCPKCGADAGVAKAPPVIGPPIVPPEQTPLRFVIPVGRSVHAIVAGYLGLFSILLFPAPLALLFGILALRDIRKHPEKLGKGRAYFALAFGGIFTVILIFALVAPLIAAK